MTRIREWLSSVARRVSAHSRLSSFIVVLIVAVGYFLYQVWSIQDSIPGLPEGSLRMVGATFDGARFVELDDRGDPIGGTRTFVLVVFDKLIHHEQGDFRFEVKRELIDCATREIALQGAGFYDDRGRQTIARVFDQKPAPSDAVDAETTLVCDHQDFGQPRVKGYRAALAQTQAVISRSHAAGH